jgi:actin-related protein 9
MDAFLAFLDHVHGLLTTTYHNTPIMLMASPQWTQPDCEGIARYVFEKTRTPALCIIHSGIATQYGLKWPNMTVIDVGFEKVDVTAIYDGSVVNSMDVGASDGDEEISGGEIFTRKLRKLLAHKGFNYDMAEQLKKSNICEVLPYAGMSETLSELPVASVTASAAVALPTQPGDNDSSTGQDQLKAGQQIQNTGGDDEGTENGNNDEDGVLDVASIVTSGQTKEFLARKEQEKTKGKPGRKPKSQEEVTPAKIARLPNNKRTHNTFYYEEIVQEEVPREPKEALKPVEENGVAPAAEKPAEGSTAPPTADGASAAPAAAPTETDGPRPDVTMTNGSKTEEPKPEEAPQEGVKTEEPKPEEPQPAANNGEAAAAAPEPAIDHSNDTPEYRNKRIRRDIEVGLERFTFAERHQIDRIVSAIYRTIQGIDDMYMRPHCWENLVFVGNGSRLRGLKDNIMQTLIARHLVSPSTATMFTSELPSNMATPTGTGSQTPVGSYMGAPHQLPSSGVNPLLQAATTASISGAQQGGATNNANSTAVGTPQAVSEAAGPVSSHHFHSQTPTSIRTANMPTYLSEWTKHGFEESMFLGAQVAARLAFCLHSNMDVQSIEAQRLMSLSRVDYK